MATLPDEVVKEALELVRIAAHKAIDKIIDEKQMVPLAILGLSRTEKGLIIIGDGPSTPKAIKEIMLDYLENPHGDIELHDYLKKT